MIERRERLPEELEGMPAGSQLAALLESVDRRALSGKDRVRLARARNRLVAHQQARLLADLHAVSWDETPNTVSKPPAATPGPSWRSPSRCGGPAPPPASAWSMPGS